MLNKDIFFDQMELLVGMYPSWGIQKDDPKVMKSWYGFFKHMDDERFTYMINQYIENENFNPTIAGLKKCDTIPRKTKDQIKHEKMLKENGLYQ